MQKDARQRPAPSQAYLPAQSAAIQWPAAEKCAHRHPRTCTAQKTLPDAPLRKHRELERPYSNRFPQKLKSSLPNAEESRKIQIVKSAISTLSFSELEAITHIFEELDGNEGILVASKIADRVGITRSVIVNALRKFESAGVIESRSSGMKGTYIKVLNDVVFDEVEKLKEQGRF